MPSSRIDGKWNTVAFAALRVPHNDSRRTHRTESSRRQGGLGMSKKIRSPLAGNRKEDVLFPVPLGLCLDVDGRNTLCAKCRVGC